MAPPSAPLSPGLYLVATPIGAARDITLRAMDILAQADVIAAEDTRTARKLMDIHGIAAADRPFVPYHDHNGPAARPKLMQALAEGKSVAYVSEAGTPMIADPGFQLVGAARSAGYPVFAAPGASAVLAALCVAGLPTDRFLFAGFAPNTSSARCAFLEELRDIPATLVLYESPKRIHKLLEDSLVVLGNRRAALCRELTKKFEETRVGLLSEFIQGVAEVPPKGEIVMVIDRGTPSVATQTDLEDALREALKTMTMKDAATAVAGRFGVARRQAYQAALDLGKT
jgi:16S rRNA (cytidine1402-2'-O)-methyltransferase